MHAHLDTAYYPIGVKPSKQELAPTAGQPKRVLPKWNYSISPRVRLRLRVPLVEIGNLREAISSQKSQNVNFSAIWTTRLLVAVLTALPKAGASISRTGIAKLGRLKTLKHSARIISFPPSSFR